MATQIPASDSSKQPGSFFSSTMRLQNRAYLNRWTMATVATAPALVRGTGSAAKLKVTNAVDYIRAGEPKTQIGAGGEIVLTGSTMAALTQCKYLAYISAAGALAVARSEVVASTAAEPDLPGLPVGCVCLGYLKIVNVTNAFIPGTTLLSAAGVTDTYKDLIWPDSGPAMLDTAGSAGLQ